MILDACALVVAYVQKLEGPAFVSAFVAYALLFMFALRQFVVPFLPHELVAAHLHIQRLGRLDPPIRK